jgi:cellulose synthase/poly-beta-1,6-N-acetylglucosamine synthase-like glycosyltransferase
MVLVVYILFFVALYFEVFMLLSYLLTQSETTDMKHAELPSVSIIVPCFNEELTLSATMHSLLALEYPTDKLQILVVNDGSRDGTLAVAQSFVHHHNVRVFDKPNGGKHTAMNYALSHITTDLVGCLDADSVVDSQALNAIVPVFADTRVAAVTPGILTKRPSTVIQHMQDAEYRLSVFNRFTLAALGSAFITPGPFSIYRTTVVQDMHGWVHGHATEDLEMALRIQQAGHLIANAPHAIVYTSSPKTFKALYKQRVRWTYGFLRNAIDYAHMFGNARYGNLSLIILPTALLSIFTAIFFAVRVTYFMIMSLSHAITRWQILGWQLPSWGMNWFYMNTSMLIFLVVCAVCLVIVLIGIGTHMITGQRRVPMGTALFVLLYSFIVPVWLSAAVVRALFKTGVRWDVHRN